MTNKTKLSKLRVLNIIFLVLLSVSTNANAAMAEVQPLTFGVFALANNVAVSTLKIAHNGANPIATNKLYPLTFGQAGHYQLTGYPAFTPLTITIADYQLKIGDSEPLTIGSFTHEAITTDVNGEALLKLGATLSTSGNSVDYGDALYTGGMNIVITW